MSSSRQLAAIMFTDIVGYTALMGRDEEKAFELLDKNRRIQKPIIEQYNGRWIKELGDGVMASFNTVSDAVNAAIKIQEACNAAKDFQLRIGIHLGEVVFENDDVFGDGVNIASRIQSLAPPGGIWISEAVHQNVANKNNIETVFIKTETLKNVKDPVPIFQIKAKGVAGPLPVVMTNNKTLNYKMTKNKRFLFFVGFTIVVLAVYFIYNYVQKNPKVPIGNISAETIDKSIAVLPFVNLSDDKNQEYFSDGMMEEIMNHLYKIGDLRIVSRTTSMTYKGSKKTLKEIANELGVATLLESSVLKDRDQVKIIVQLIDGKTDQPLWAETYTREFKDIFAIQSEIAKQVASALKIKMDPAVTKRIEYAPTANLSAYDLYLQAMAKVTTADWTTIEKMMQQVIFLDSSFAPAYATLGLCWILKGGFGGKLTSDELLEHALPLLKKAVALDENLSSPHAYLSYTYLWFRWDFEAAGKEWQKFFELGPSTSSEDYLGGYPDFLLASGRFRETFEFATKVIASNKYNVIAWYSLAQYYYFKQDKDSGIATIERCSKLFGANEWLLLPTANINTLAHRYNEGIVYLENHLNNSLKSRSPFVLSHLSIAYLGTGQKEKSEKLIEEIKSKTNLPVGSPCFYIAAVYAAMRQMDIAIQWLEKSYKNREVEMYWIKVEPLFKSLHNEPRFKELLKKIDFKL
jgi:TolB-like protein/class 3 adenylate cyclase